MFNPATQLVMDVAAVYHAYGFDRPFNAETNKKIINLMDENYKNEYYHDYYATKTFLVLEVLSNLVQGRMEIARSLTDIIVNVHKLHYDADVTLDIGRSRVLDFVVSEVVDNKNAKQFLKSKKSVEIMAELISIGYIFHREFVAMCGEGLPVLNEVMSI